MGRGSTFWLTIFILAFGSIAAAADESPATDLVAKRLRRLCGNADLVWDYIHEETGESKKLMNSALSSRQGETGRRFLMYADRSWVLVFDYFDPLTADHDVSCIVATGAAEEAFEGSSLMVERLPEEALGEPPQFTALDRILRLAARRIEL